MRNLNPSPSNGAEDEEMTVELDLEDGSHVVCAIITILECQGKDYIVLLPLDENGENDDGEVWFYRYTAALSEDIRLSWCILHQAP